ncbi:MAG: hypothetical protein LLG14_20490 [Nocardiaceae bacterium]|nr:hypothetical protein [Nocardiaceae bacterium]
MSLPDVYYQLANDDAPLKPTRVELYDANWGPLGPVTGWEALQVEFHALNGGSGAITLPPDCDPAEILVTADPDERHYVVVEMDSKRWAGYVTNDELEGKDGVPSTTFPLEHVWQIVADVPIYRDPGAALTGAAQPKDKITVSGNCLTLAHDTLANNLIRMGALTDTQFPIVLKQLSGTDTSAQVVVDLDYHSFGETFADAFNQAGVFMHVDLWLPGDPIPEGIWNLRRPTLVVELKDHNAYSGFSDASEGDPLAQYRRVVNGDGFEESNWPITSGRYEQGDEGTDPDDPWVFWRLDGPGVASYKLSKKRATAHTVSWIGRRKEWAQERLDEISTFWTRYESGAVRGDVYAQGSLVYDVGPTGVFARNADNSGAIIVVGSVNPQSRRAIASTDPATSQVTPGDPLEADKITDDTRADNMGYMGLGERFVSAKNADDVLGALYECRGQYSLTVDVLENCPFRFGKHFDIGDPVVFGIPGIRKRYHDVCTYYEFTDDANTPQQTKFGFGYPSVDPPVVDQARRLRRIEEYVASLARETITS